MIILEKRCLLEGASGSSNYRDSEINETYYIKYDEVVSDSNEAIRHSGFFVGEAHPNSEWFSLVNVDADAISGQEWIIGLSYSTDQTNDNPSDVDFKTDVRHGKWTFQRVVTQDKETGADIVNSAGETFDSPIVEEVACPLLSVTRRRTSPDMSLIELIGSINSSAFTLVGVKIPKYCAQLSDYVVERGQDQEGNPFYTQTFEFKLNFTKSKVTNVMIGFKAEVANVGFSYKSDQPDNNGYSNGKRTIYDKDGQPISTPSFLSVDGLSPRADPNYLQFVINNLYDFGSFSLPTKYPNY